MYKALLVLCTQTLFVQIVLSQCCTNDGPKCPLGYTRESLGYYGSKCPYGFGDDWRYNGVSGLDASCVGALEYSPTSGGELAVSSGSTIAPAGLSVASKNEYKGQLLSAGELPFVGIVAVEGVLPTVGAGAVNHHCGDGINAMASNGLGYGGYEHDYTGAYGLGARRFESCGAPKYCGCGIY